MDWPAAAEIHVQPQGTAYAAAPPVRTSPIESRFVFWFNGNGIPERYWIPARDRRGLSRSRRASRPLAPFRNDIHVLSGLDNPAARCPDPATATPAP